MLPIFMQSNCASIPQISDCFKRVPPLRSSDKVAPELGVPAVHLILSSSARREFAMIDTPSAEG